jgi:hypothetical protein
LPANDLDDLDARDAMLGALDAEDLHG